MGPGDVAIPGRWSDLPPTMQARDRLNFGDLPAHSRKVPKAPRTTRHQKIRCAMFELRRLIGIPSGAISRFWATAHQADVYLRRKRQTPGRGQGFGRSVEGWRQRDFSASMRAGITLWTSPTIPRSATAKIGASGSLLMAMMFLEPFMPTRCCVAPEIPAAM